MYRNSNHLEMSHKRCFKLCLSKPAQNESMAFANPVFLCLIITVFSKGQLLTFSTTLDYCKTLHVPRAHLLMERDVYAMWTHVSMEFPSEDWCLFIAFLSISFLNHLPLLSPAKNQPTSHPFRIYLGEISALSKGIFKYG